MDQIYVFAYEEFNYILHKYGTEITDKYYVIYHAKHILISI